MAQTISEDAVTADGSNLNIISTRPGYEPVTDLDAFFAGLPKFMDEEVQAFEEAIAEDRAQRRAAAGVTR